MPCRRKSRGDEEDKPAVRRRQEVSNNGLLRCFAFENFALLIYSFGLPYPNYALEFGVQLLLRQRGRCRWRDIPGSERRFLR